MATVCYWDPRGRQRGTCAIIAVHYKLKRVIRGLLIKCFCASYLPYPYHDSDLRAVLRGNSSRGLISAELE